MREETCKTCANLECRRWGQNRPACRDYIEPVDESEEAYREHMDIRD